MTLIGILATILLAFCSIPELIRTLKDKKCHLGFNLLWMWWLGCGLMMIYTHQDLVLFLNYLINFLVIGIMFFYKIKFK